jgi:hypothetical protein
MNKNRKEFEHFKVSAAQNYGRNWESRGEMKARSEGNKGAVQRESRTVTFVNAALGIKVSPGLLGAARMQLLK